MKHEIIDLHTHSLCSDGSMSPTELVKHAAESGLSAIALTDHDTAEGLKEALEAGKTYGIEVIPGIELSAQSDTETHILGYFIDPDAKALQEAVAYIQKIRVKRIEMTLEKLQDCGIDISMDEVREKAGTGILCRAHVAKILTERGLTESPSDAFKKWLNVGRPAYADIQALTDEEAIRLIRECGGDAYLAHLHLTKKSGDELDAFVARLKNAGLTGIEGWYTDYTPGHNRIYRALAQKYDLKLSGGTDFHGTFKPHIRIGRGLGELEIPHSVLEEMKKR